ncbi:MAG: valine--tRNA ligase [Chloroflexi bacterium]|nr:valine--tRNA ligase [Chloroflexota bacterium]
MPTLEGRYDFRTAEPRLQEQWAADGIYQFDPAVSGPVYTVDTPPPTVSGRIHIGHVYSYTQADVMIRYHRMKGEHVLYPFGFDDNGLPTERFTEQARGIKAQEVGRRKFIEACLELSEQVEAQFERFWKRLGLSVDWRLKYSTIDPRSRRISQLGFLDLYAKDQVYRSESPSLWCPECQTGVAQAEIDDKAGVKTKFTTIPFFAADGRELPIATTRPELLAACVAVMVNPNDTRYRAFVGQKVRTPIFGQEVPVIADDKADQEKGTGAVMCCTFGDVTDVYWWRTHSLPLRIVLTRDGRLNELAGPYAGMRIRAARTRILEDLAAQGLVRDQREIEHTVGVHERCQTEIEYLVISQWFVKVLNNKQLFIDAGRRMRWFPEYMRGRYESWIEGLNWDWNLSRQRYYGVPFPAWYCGECRTPVMARPEDLPIDPQEVGPPVAACAKCGGTRFEPDTDVMDTWATSSLTPEICGTLLEPLGVSAEVFAARFRPMTLRPNAHDIIRTWDFYTTVRSLYQRGDIPWTEVLISGHALDPAGKKISKSRLSAAEDPSNTLEQFSADAIRYWATTVRTGGDTLLNDDTIRNGNRLVTKLWNAAKLALAHLDGYSPPAEPPESLNATDRWILARLHETIRRATRAMDEYEFASAKAEVERFFWADFADNYLELVKFRLYGDEAPDEDGTARSNAQYVLYHTLSSVIGMLAPFLPHITDEIYMRGFGEHDGCHSVHVSTWPRALEGWQSDAALRHGRNMLGVTEEVRKWKSERQLGMSAPLKVVRIEVEPAAAEALAGASLDLRSVTRAGEIEIAPVSGVDQPRVGVEAVPIQ